MWFTLSIFFGIVVVVGILVWYVAVLIKKHIVPIIWSMTKSIVRGLRDNEYVVNIIKQFPKIAATLEKRLDRRDFFGLPLTLLGVAAAYVFVLFIGAAEGLVNTEAIVSADTRLNKIFILLRTPFATKIFLWITYVGNWRIAASLCIVTTILFWVWRKRVYALAFAVTAVGSAGADELVKLALHRPRPLNPVYIESSFSFPSGHATIVVSLYGFLFYSWWRHTKRASRKVWIVCCAVALGIVVGLSRLYLGVHYLSDVWGGYLLGLVWLIFGISVVEWQRFRAKKQPRIAFTAKKRNRVRLLTLCLVIFEIGLFIGLAGRFKPETPGTVVSGQPPIVVDPVELSAVFSLSRYSETLTGGAQEPLSFMIIAPDDQTLTDVFVRAGWQRADALSARTFLNALFAGYKNQPYITAPMTPSFWNGEVNAIGFEKQTNQKSIRQRHHARIWKTNLVTKDGQFVYVGTASFDVGVKWGVTHQISPDIDTERDMLIHDIIETGSATVVSEAKFVAPVLGKNFTGDPFFTDGRVYIVLFTRIRQ